MKGFFTKEQTASASRPDGKTYSCASCGMLKESRSPRLRLQGNFSKGIMIVGSASTTTEDETGVLWNTRAGKYLKHFLSENDIDLEEDCLCINAVNCRCDDAPANYEIDCCRKNLIAAIKEHKPKIILLFGDAALYSIVGRRWKKDLGDIKKWRGWQIPDIEYNTWICPTFHPAELKDKAESVSEILWKQDIRKALNCLDVPLPTRNPQIEIIEDLTILDSITSGVVGIDYETTGLKPHKKGHRIVCASVADTNDHCYVFMMPKKKKEQAPWIRLLANPNVRKMAHNLKYEEAWSTVILGQPVVNWLWDSMQAAHILDNRVGITGLKFQTYVHFGLIDYDSKISPYLKSSDTKDGNGFNRIEELLQIPGGAVDLMTYCGWDTLNQRRLGLIQMRLLRNNPAYTLFHDGILALGRAELQGLRVDLDYVEAKKIIISKEIAKTEKELKESAFYKHWEHYSRGKININSNAQLAGFLYKGKKLEPAKLTESGQGATDEEALQQMNIPELNKILHIRKLRKIKDTYLEAYEREQVDGYLHPFFNLNTVLTYRSSSDRPNFQNIPKRDKEAKKIVRSALFPRPGHQLVEVDFSSLEVSIAACYHKDPVMLDYLIHKKDMHKDMAIQIFCIDGAFDKDAPGHAVLRQAAKNSFVFPQFYGDYYRNNALGLCSWIQLPGSGTSWSSKAGVKLPDGTPIAEHLRKHKIKGFEDFVMHIKNIENDFWNNRFKVYGKWKKQWYSQYLKNGYIENYTGFRFSGDMKKNEVINYPVQSSAFHCLLWSFIQLDKYLSENNYDSKIIGQIHDSMVIDVHPNEIDAVLKIVDEITSVKLAATWDWIIVPLHVDSDIGVVDTCWAEMMSSEKYFKLIK